VGITMIVNATTIEVVTVVVPYHHSAKGRYQHPGTFPSIIHYGAVDSTMIT